LGFKLKPDSLLRYSVDFQTTDNQNVDKITHMLHVFLVPFILHTPPDSPLQVLGDSLRNIT
jgi:hypothetical protein